MAIGTTGNGDTEEDEVVTNVVEISTKQCPIIGKGKGKGKQCAQGKCDLGLEQQSHCKCRLQTTLIWWLTNFFSESSFQPCDDDLSDPDPDVLNDFNVGNNAEDVDDWVSDEHIVELSHKNPSKISKAMAIEVNQCCRTQGMILTQVCSQRLTLIGAGPSSMLSIAGSPLGEGIIGPIGMQSVGGSMPSMPSILGLMSTQSSSEFSQPSSVYMPLGGSSQDSSNDIPLGVFDQGSSINMPLGVSSQGNGVDMPLVISNQGIPATGTLGLYHTYGCPYVYWCWSQMMRRI